MATITQATTIPKMTAQMQVATITNQVQTMSSREIAKLCGKPHDNVLKMIRGLIDRGVLLFTTPQQYVNQQNHQTYTEYLADKRDSLVIVARLSPEFTGAVIDRWQELENQQPKLPNFNNPAEMAREWARQFEEKQALEQQARINAPKVNHYNLVVDKSNLLTATEIGSKVGKSAIALNKALSVLGVYNGNLKRSKVFKQWFIDKGLGVAKQTDNGYTQALFTTKGEAWIIEQLEAINHE